MARKPQRRITIKISPEANRLLLSILGRKLAERRVRLGKADIVEELIRAEAYGTAQGCQEKEESEK